MIKYTHEENRQALKGITAQAQAAGLIGADERLIYEKGGRGTATVIRLVKVNADQTRKALMRPTWVPEFGYKDGPSFVGSVLDAVSNTLYSVIALDK